MKIAVVDAWWSLEQELNSEWTEGGKGHHEWIMVVVRALRERGHTVEIVAPGALSAFEADWQLFRWPCWAQDETKTRQELVRWCERFSRCIVYFYECALFNEMFRADWLFLTFTPYHRALVTTLLKYT